MPPCLQVRTTAARLRIYLHKRTQPIVSSVPRIRNQRDLAASDFGPRYSSCQSVHAFTTTPLSEHEISASETSSRNTHKGQECKVSYHSVFQSKLSRTMHAILSHYSIVIMCQLHFPNIASEAFFQCEAATP